MSSFANQVYNVSRKWLTVTFLAACPIQFFVNAPFGRFSPSNESWMMVDGIKAWIIMELFSPAVFLYAYITSPISYYDPPLPAWDSPQSILAGLYLVHYANRALINPLRTPSRSKSHIIVPLSAIAFNIVNGFIQGSYLSSPYARMYLNKGYTFQRSSFYLGLGLWFVGFIGNIVHDEILLDIRRKAKSKGKGKADDQDKKKVQGPSTKEHYAIPYGLLYKFISYPNYLCEWIEWFGFALAAAPLPIEPSMSGLIKAMMNIFSVETIKMIVFSPAHLFAPNLAAPYIFFICEILAMLPRAYNGHKWYKITFGDNYPEERKAVIPFVL
ncbi:hypothetical protein APHAL10511_004591 [Amanita phalloides]|nr:hypothetical protein APHAL10511_004591 [Amanita phalloides]